jgi:uncharacterized protein (DUF2235 family)
MGKRIILLSDGTGNAAASVWRTNVWRIFESLDLDRSDQVAIYDDGVGTSSFKPLAILGGAFGWGLKRNVIDLYKFVCRNYESEKDEIFGFGFSRGAFMIRIVAGLIFDQGLVPYNKPNPYHKPNVLIPSGSPTHFTSEHDLHKKAEAAYRAYRKTNFHTNWYFLFRWICGLIRRSNCRKEEKNFNINIRFLGLWDTVAAYGLPIDEMTRGVSQWIWPLELPKRDLDKRVKRACHALSLDDERTTFHPILWNESDETPAPPGADTKDERISQVWFAGVHSNVGGGYADDSLAHIPLFWIMTEAQECGLSYKTDALAQASSARDKDGRLYDSRQGLGGYYRYGPRNISVLSGKAGIAVSKIHESALRRMRHEAHPYAPIGIPELYEVVTDDRKIVRPEQFGVETPEQAAARAKAQERVWNIVWLRRVVYFLTGPHCISRWCIQSIAPFTAFHARTNTPRGFGQFLTPSA